MNVVELQCKRCGGMLPPPGSGSPFVTCPFCGTTHAVSAPAIAITSEPKAPSELTTRKEAAERSWDAARAKSTDPVLALRVVVAELAHDLKSEQELERAARLGEALVNGFDQENKTHAITDRLAVVRIGEAALKAVIELRALPDTEVNIPFLMATGEGPKHLLVSVTRSKLAELDAMGVYVVKEAAPPPPIEETHHDAPPKPEKKKGWWPFG